MCSQLAPVSLCSRRSLGFQPGFAQQKEPQPTNPTGCKAERGRRVSLGSHRLPKTPFRPMRNGFTQQQQQKKAGETENPSHEAKICGRWATLVRGVGPGPSPPARVIDYLLRDRGNSSRCAASAQPAARVLSAEIAELGPSSLL